MGLRPTKADEDMRKPAYFRFLFGLQMAHGVKGMNVGDSVKSAPRKSCAAKVGSGTTQPYC